MNDGNAKQQIAEKIKSNSNILVTVSTNPSVDELSAALGLTLLLNKMNKHATAVFSGAIPPAITFLDPQKTFENTVNSLRDFIIALDKEKADHLRYKVDGDVVKIFITPYRTTISSEDLDFSQGDYNVELVLALGVKDRDDLDGALAAHGRILHDATVMTMSAGETQSELGSVDWHDENASSLSEMLVGLSDTLKGDKALLDEQIATAFLTGIVAATDRFSNNRTSSRVMTMAAQLMSAGANQQLIASKLEEAHEIGATNEQQGKNSDGTTNLSEGKSTKLDKKQSGQDKKPPEAIKQKKVDDGSLTISHEKEGDVDEVGAATAAEQQELAAEAAQDELEKRSKEVAVEQRQAAAKVAEQNLAKQLASVAPSVNPADTPSVADLRKDLAAASAEVSEAAEHAPETVTVPLNGAVSNDQWQSSNQAPSMGGTLNATTEQAAEDERRTLDDKRNHTILSHNNSNNYLGNNTPTFQSPLNAASQPEEDPPMVDPFKETPSSPVADNTLPTAYAQTIQPPVTTLADIDKQNRVPHEEARAAVDAAFGAVPYTPPAPNAVLSSLPPMPPLPDFSTLPPLPPVHDPNAPVGGLPPEKLEDVFAAPAATSLTSTPPQSNDPGQFKIPGQS
jgi:hypothetical protein